MAALRSQRGGGDEKGTAEIASQGKEPWKGGAPATRGEQVRVEPPPLGQTGWGPSVPGFYSFYRLLKSSEKQLSQAWRKTVFGRQWTRKTI